MSLCCYFILKVSVNPGCSTFNVTDRQTGRRYLSGQVSQPIRNVWQWDGRRRAAGADQAAQGVQRAVHRTLAVPVVGAHVTTCRGHKETGRQVLLL